MAQHTLLGIDIGGTKIAGGIVAAETGAASLVRRISTEAQQGGAVVRDRALALAQELLAEAAVQGISPTAIGVGAGGQIDPVSGVVLSATDVLPGWTGIRIKEAFETAFSLPTSVDNDVNALAAGESRFGAGRGFPNLVYLALGTGVGGAVLVHGSLYHSRTGVSAELGHLLLYPDGLPCTCGGRGCLEQYVCGPTLWRRYRANGGTAETPEALHHAAQTDPQSPAAQTLREVGTDLGLGLASLANIFGPDRFVIGGGLADLGDLLLDPARAVLRERALPAVRETPVIPAGLGRDAAVIGAASLALHTIPTENQE